MSAVDQDDAAVRRLLREDLDTTFVVEAAAGTGKTTVLVARILALIRLGKARLSGIIAVTFTEKAAGEMKLRIREQIEKARAAAQSTQERYHLEEALKELEGARIGTIHSLCADLLRERPIDAGVDPMFAVASDEDARELLDSAFSGWMDGIISSPPEGIRRVLRRTIRRNAPSARKQLKDAAWRLIEHRDFLATWRRDPSFQRDAELEAVLGELARLASAVKAAPLADYPRKVIGDLWRFIEDLEHREAVAPRDHDGLEALLRDLATHKLWKLEVFAKKHAELMAERTRVGGLLQRFVGRADADIAALLRDELLPVLERYEAEKSASGRVDFTDLLLKTRDLLKDQDAARKELQRRFTHLFVDEFQDTDPLQADILLLLAAEDPDAKDPETLRTIPGKLFVVGDPKQSIYAFRRADVVLYHRIKARLRDQGAKLVYLSRSFRSVREIQSAVNGAFSVAMGTGSATQADYVPLQPGRSDVPPEQPAVVALSVPGVYSSGFRPQISRYRVDETLPSTVGAFVDFLVNRSGWTVTESDRSGRVPLQPRHICILFKRFQSWFEDVTRPYAVALENRRIPHVLVGGRSFHAREEVLALRNALTAIEWPDDELAVFAALRGPFFALQDDALLAFRGAFGRMHPLRPLELEKATPLTREVADALALLGQLHWKRNRRPIADTVSLLLERARVHAGLAFWTAGEQALANVLHLVDLGRRAESSGATSFRAFVELLHAQAEEGVAEEARVVEEGTEGVRLMTVHRAKGLEFPVVILADLTANAVQARPSRHVDTARGLWAEPLAGCMPLELLENEETALERDGEEAVRLAYVAATRARDLLVVPAVGDQRMSGWLEPLHPVLYPRPGTERTPKDPPATPRQGKESVLDRPPEIHADGSVAPGLHVPETGEHGVVWWDPATLTLNVESDVDERRERVLLPKDPENEQRGTQAYAAWEAAREALLQRGAVPSRLIETVREAAAKVQAPPHLEVVTSSAHGSERPSGPRFGALVHAVLAKVAFDANAQAIRKETENQARLLAGVTDAERGAAQAAVAAALAHPLWARAQACTPNDVRRETPVMLRREDGVLIEGVVDLAFRETLPDGKRWTVVEIKTDAAAEAVDPYHAQVALYVEAIAQATGEAAHGVIARV